MTGEPVTSSALTAILYKALAFLLGASFAAVVVMSLTQPRSTKEFFIALICTLAFSIGGGSMVVMWLHLQFWVNEPFGLMALFCLCFVCGLPGWVMVRWWFHWVAKNPDKNPAEAIKETRDYFR
jgi:hypothetical protein